VYLPSVLWLGGRKGIRPVKKLEWWGAGLVICLERGADLHMAQLMPLSLTVSCFIKIQIGFTFLVPAHPGSPGKRAVKRLCVCVWSLLCLLITAVSCANTAEPIEMPFGVSTLQNQRHHALPEDPDNPTARGHF